MLSSVHNQLLDAGIDLEAKKKRKERERRHISESLRYLEEAEEMIAYDSNRERNEAERKRENGEGSRSLKYTGIL